MAVAFQDIIRGAMDCGEESFEITNIVAVVPDFGVCLILERLKQPYALIRVIDGIDASYVPLPFSQTAPELY